MAKNLIKTFKGTLADGGQDRINLGTIKGEMGYRINKFGIFFTQPGVDSQDSIVKVYKIKQTTVPTSAPTVDFTDTDLLAVAQLVQAASVLYQTTTGPIIFDTELFNQDIYVTHTDSEGAYGCNYYLELEQIPLTLNEANVATLKNIRAKT
jgi:hypothetical protein